MGRKDFTVLLLVVLLRDIGAPLVLKKVLFYIFFYIQRERLENDIENFQFKLLFRELFYLYLFSEYY